MILMDSYSSQNSKRPGNKMCNFGNLQHAPLRQPTRRAGDSTAWVSGNYGAAVLGPWVQGISTASRIPAPLQHARYIKDPKRREQVFLGNSAVRKFGLVCNATLWMLKHSHWISAVFSDEKMFCWNYHQSEKQKKKENVSGQWRKLLKSMLLYWGIFLSLGSHYIFTLFSQFSPNPKHEIPCSYFFFFLKSISYSGVLYADTMNIKLHQSCLINL